MKFIFTFIFFSQLFLQAQCQEKNYTVLYEYNKDAIPDSALIQLMKLIHSNSVERVLLEGHCDSIGSKEYNYELSTRRAESVKKLFIQNGISKSMIKTCIGYGKDKPKVANSDEVSRQLNRRVQVTLYLNEHEIDNKLQENIPIATPIVVLKKEDLKKDHKIVLKNLLFYAGRHILKQSSYSELETLILLLQENPSLEIEIQGHVCCTTIEPDGYDWDLGTHNLSVMRAKTIYEFLIENNIKASRLTYKGFGGTQKINQDESSEELKAINRRVEIKVIHE